MSKDDDNKPDYEPDVEAMNYGTVWTNSLFEPGQATFKFSRQGSINIRIPWSAIIGGSIMGAIFAGISALIFIMAFDMGMYGFPVVIFGFVLGAIVGGKIGTWSPMKKTTGEDLMTWIMISIRQRLSSGGGKISRTELNSMMVGGREGRIVSCTQWIGTQPLKNAPPMSAYEEDFKSEYVIKPRGEFNTIQSSYYNDGLGDRFAS